MTKNKIQRLLAILCAVAAAFCMVLGFINMPKQNGAAGQEILRTMRIQTLLSATGDSVVESYVAIAWPKHRRQPRHPAAVWQLSVKQ